MSVKKVANYTTEQEKLLSATYDPNADEETRENQIAECAAKLGKNVKSIRAKLVRMELYVKKEYRAKTGEKPETKEKIVADIAAILGMVPDNLPQLEKATKKALTVIRTALAVAADSAPDGVEESSE